MTFEVDRTSLLVGVPGAALLGAIELALEGDGLTLGFPVVDATVADWLARGAPGAPSAFADPADHLVAGLTGVLTGGRRVDVRPSPRRAVGPDLIALFVGASDRFASIERVWLRVHRKAARRVSDPIAADFDLDPPVSREEASLLDAIERELLR